LEPHWYMRADGRRSRWTEMSKLIGAFATTWTRLKFGERGERVARFLTFFPSTQFYISPFIAFLCFLLSLLFWYYYKRPFFISFNWKYIIIIIIIIIITIITIWFNSVSFFGSVVFPPRLFPLLLNSLFHYKFDTRWWGCTHLTATLANVIITERNICTGHTY